MIKLHLGCGKRDFGSNWIHIDGGNFPHLHNSGDTITSLHNFDTDSVDLIYASHVIEYFDREEIKDVLKEWYRVLKPKGILRLAVPDFVHLKWVWENTGEIEKILGPLYGKMEMGNKTIYHKTCYDFKSLSKVLTNNGFKNPKLWDWRKTEHSQFDDHSQAYFPHMDKENGILISLNVECQKPDEV